MLVQWSIDLLSLSGLESREIGLGCFLGVPALELGLTCDDLAFEVVPIVRFPEIVHEVEHEKCWPCWREISRQQSLPVFHSSPL